jgi:transposase
MARSGLIHQWNQHNIGRPKRVSEEYCDRLHELVTHSPRQYGYCFDRWTAGCLSKHLAKEFAIEVSERHISRLLKEMGLSTRQKVNKRMGIAIDDLSPNQSNEPYYFLNLMSIS